MRPGPCSAILSVATATAEGIRQVAAATKVEGGAEAIQLKIAQQYIEEFGQIAKESNTLVLPASVADVGSMIALAMNAVKGTSKPASRGGPPPVPGSGR